MLSRVFIRSWAFSRSRAKFELFLNLLSSLMVFSWAWSLSFRSVFSCFRVLISLFLAWSSCFVGRSWSSLMVFRMRV
ncbi:hypothetical protein HPB14_07869 (plasmid) [Helicobacter pylori HUP-B14]|nr:hypothetical protein HPB14_07849 [Helicobacter pylori HUP-B14]AFI08221.1 hypothetical protein HPB14_07869 [Helicobacter pylori HUP-B14]